MRLLIVLPGALGDVVRGLPLLGRLRRAWPDAHLAWAVERPSAPVLEGHPWLDELHVLQRRGGLAAWMASARALRRGRYDVALDLGRGAKSAALAAASGARRRIGLDRRDSREGAWLAATETLAPQGAEKPKLLQFLAFGERLGVPDGPIEFGLAPRADVGPTVDRWLGDLPRPLVVASLGSSCSSRRWFPESTAAVLDRVAERCGAGIVLSGLQTDEPFAAAVAAAMRSAPRNLAGRTTLPELVGVLAGAQVVVGPDSGTLHVAAAVGARVVSLWGATSATRSTPWGQDDGVVEGRAPCRPCFLSACPIGRPCMRSIDPGVVGARIEEALRR